MADEEVKKSHKNRHAGRKAAKKKAKSSHAQVLTDKQKNPKAFGFHSIHKTREKFIRSQDILSKKHHIPVVDRTPVEPPPVLVAILGGPKSGKSTLLRCLINNFCNKKKLENIVGPITVVAGKKKRITFIEVNNDINSMIDVAKVADIVLLLIDATFGIEMEVFEFLEICKAHGTPRVMGILNHLDKLKHNKALKKKKKELKQRFQVELYPGAKLFNLTGLLNDSYLRNEIRNLCRFISVMKFRPLVFRNSHAHLFVDRVEDLTSPKEIMENKKCDRNVVLYGYVRGIPFQSSQIVHIGGVGDYKIKSLAVLPDPCPLPEVLKKRSLNTEERLIYAPMSGLGGVVYDKDAVYIEGNQQETAKKEDEDESEEEESPDLRETLMKAEKTTGEKQENTTLTLFQGAAPLSLDAYDEASDSEDDSDADPAEQNMNFEEVTDEFGRTRRRIIFDKPIDDDKLDDENDDNSDLDDEEMEMDDEDGDDPGNREDLFIEAAKTYKKTFCYHMRQMAYGDLIEENVEDDTEFGGGLFRSKPKNTTNDKSIMDMFDNMDSLPAQLTDLSEQMIMMSIKDSFTTGEHAEDAETALKLDDELAKEEDEDSGVEGDTDEEETPQETAEAPSKKRKRENQEKTVEEKRFEKKRRLKELFETDPEGNNIGEHFDSLKKEMSQQAELNQGIFDDLDEDTRAEYEGVRAGKYVRMEFSKLPYEFIEHADPTYPIIVGGLNVGEETFGYLRVRMKVHRWYPKILKNRDPLILSLGWRRFQTMMFYAKREDDMRLRSLKYAKKYMHVEAVFWGPTLPSTASYGFVGFQKITGDRVSHFRIAANGVLLENDENQAKITKKLKLIGYPCEIFQKTCFIKDMFHNELEVNSYIGAKLQTQSGIRGLVKKAKRTEGIFRATFEDKIQMSDVVFLKTWATVEVQKFYSCLKNLLMPADQRSCWQGMRTVAEIKKDRNIRNEVNPDHLYTEVLKRKTHVPQSFHIPNKLQASLPYKNRPKMLPKQNKIKRVVVVKDPEEVKVDNFMTRLKTIVNNQIRTNKMMNKKKSEKYKKSAAFAEKERLQREKKRKSEICRLRSLQNKSKTI